MRCGAARRRPSRARARSRSARRQSRGRWCRAPAVRRQRRAGWLRWWAYAVSFDAPAGANRVESSRVYPYGTAALRRTEDDASGLGIGPACPPNERGFSDEIIRRRSKCRPIIHSRTPFVSNREMRDRRETYTKDGCTAKSQTINSAVWSVIVFSVKTLTNKASCKQLPPYFVLIFKARNCRHMIGRVSTIAI